MKKRWTVQNVTMTLLTVGFLYLLAWAVSSIYINDVQLVSFQDFCIFYIAFSFFLDRKPDGAK